jgi:hypothetical protein
VEHNLSNALRNRWSEYATGGDGEMDGCGFDGGDAYWYMGRTQCYRANAAYSLYGAKKGESGGCSAGHFINSFFTNYGLESFADPLGITYDDVGASSTCESEVNDDFVGKTMSNGAMLFENSASYTTACSANGGFIKAKFQGAYCSGNNFVSSISTFDSLDESFVSLTCRKVYDSEGNFIASNVAANDEEADNGNDIPGHDSIAFQLLSYSSACSVLEYPERCPDPHGLKSARDKALDKAAKAHYRTVPTIIPILTSIFFMTGIVLFYLSWQLHDNEPIESDDSAILAARSEVGDFSKHPLLSHVSESFARTASNLSQRTMSIKERLQDYAEEEVFSMDTVDEDATYTPPEEKGEGNTLEEEPVIITDVDVANAMLAEKGVPTPKKKDDKKFKRPFLARCSRKLFGRKKKATTQA